MLGYAALWSTRIVGDHTIPWIVLRELMYANFVVAVFNFLPGLPLDGGRMLRAVIWKLSGRPATATIAAAWAGRVLAVALLVAVPLRMGGTGGDFVYTVVWAAAISAFMWTGAGQAIRATRFRARLPELQATQARAQGHLRSGQHAARRGDPAGRRGPAPAPWWLSTTTSKPIAILNEAAVMATPPQRRPWIEAGTLARSIEPSLVLPADIGGMALLEAVRRAPASEYLLVEPSGQVYGVLAARDLDGVFSGV